MSRLKKSSYFSWTHFVFLVSHEVGRGGNPTLLVYPSLWVACMGLPVCACPQAPQMYAQCMQHPLPHAHLYAKRLCMGGEASVYYNWEPIHVIGGGGDVLARCR
jgi:hypothetical protein